MTARDRFDPLVRPVVAHYERQLETHGATARGMDWKDEASQRLRFAVLCGVAALEGRTLHEVGAGAGHLYDFLRERGIGAVYSGSDASAAMVAAARARHPEGRFVCCDVLEAGTGERFDAVVGSGLFHVKLGADDRAWRAFVEAGVARMFAACRVAIAFNLMSNQVDYRVPDLYYSDPGEMLEFCRRRLARHVVLRHDYPLHEYTIYVYREPRRA